MALKGTLKDFGIADILQLIGQQQKTGVLHLVAKEHEVHLAFKDGNIVKAESATRKKKDLIGNMLVRAEVISDAQLIEALETQKRTLQRLGDVLVAINAITADRFRRMVQLQATETLYRLFLWKSGTYEFEIKEVEQEPDGIVPLRAEAVLMEGFRMVDEWPLIRKTIPSDELTFERIKVVALPEPTPEKAAPDEGLDDSLDAAFGEAGGGEKSEFKQVGDSERRLYELISPNRTVRKLVDLSCLGEFETCKALANLVTLEYVKPLAQSGPARRFNAPSLMARMLPAAGRLAASLVVLSALAYVGSRLSSESLRLVHSAATTYADPAAQKVASAAQISRIRAALDVYRLEAGDMPEKLEKLVETGLLSDEDLSWPWRERYYYRRVASREFILLPPLR